MVSNVNEVVGAASSQNIYFIIAGVVTIFLIIVIGFLLNALLDNKTKKTPNTVQVGGYVFRKEWKPLNAPKSYYDPAEDHQEWEKRD